jgi:hypothetical protein
VKGPIERHRGQGQVEYILLIAVVCLFIVVALIWFRDAVADYTLRVADWIQGTPPSQVAPASVSPPTPTPEPPPTPETLNGQWCVDDIDTGLNSILTMRFEPTGEGTYRVLFRSSNGEFREGYSVTSNGPDQFTLYNLGMPVGSNFARQPDGSFSGSGWILRRC